MNRALFFVVLLGLGIILFAAQGQNIENKAKPAETGTLPLSLDSLYPPISKIPVYLIGMHEMAAHFTAVILDFQQQDTANVLKQFEALKAKYIECAELVPEWKYLYPIEQINNLGEAVKSGDMESFMKHNRQLGAICHSCHVQHMSDVQYKYHWNDFADFMVSDPILKKDVPYRDFMLFTAVNMHGIGNELAEEQTDNAKEQLSQFAARFDALAETCELCHTEERYYFVDKTSKDMITNIQSIIEAEPIDGHALKTSLEALGEEACSKCHLVHIPPTLAKERWRTMMTSK